MLFGRLGSRGAIRAFHRSAAFGSAPALSSRSRPSSLRLGSGIALGRNALVAPTSAFRHVRVPGLAKARSMTAVVVGRASTASRWTGFRFPMWRSNFLLRRSCGSAKGGSGSRGGGGGKRSFCAKPAEAQSAPATLQEMAQIDAGFYQGLGVLSVVLGAWVATSDEAKRDLLVSTVKKFRALGIKVSNIPDHELLFDYIKLNIEASKNVLLSSPAFYFMYHAIHGQSMTTCVLRGLTGTVRIVPFMFSFYALLAFALPFFTNVFMEKFDQDYGTAKGNAQTFMLLSGLVVLEALVELRGCGVQFSQMRPAALALFVPALIGRLATGVLTQANKIGEEFENALPADFKAADAPEWKKGVNSVFDKFCLDDAFFVTLMGTAFFQHILNGTTFILLTKGKAAGAADFLKYLTVGTRGSALGGIEQFMRTIAMRFGFVLTWNWFSSQKTQVTCVDMAIEELDKGKNENL